MSAYMVDREHIRYLIEAASSVAEGILRGQAVVFYDHDGNRHEYQSVGNACESERDYSDLGQMLWDENRRSIEARYPDTRENFASAPGKCDEAEAGCQYGEHNYSPMWDAFPAVQVLKAVQCFEYQSCEHAGWKASPAKGFCDFLRSAQTKRMPGYESAAWGAPKPNPALRRLI